ncbi:MAG: MBL fold metallo-hydrolase [Methanoregula sp.]
MEHDLRPADRVEVTVLVDNYTDQLLKQSTAVDHRMKLDSGNCILAEHGLSCLVRVYSQSTVHTILMDTGLSTISLFHNAKQLGCNLDEAECVVLSHGHHDHTGGLVEFFRRSSRPVPLVFHPDAFLARRITFPGMSPVPLPHPDLSELGRSGAILQERASASALAAGHLLVTGEVPRITGFERGLPGAEAWNGSEWVTDPIRDDQALVIHIRNKGLVIISGCAHAGIINTIRYAQELTGTGKVHAVLGGFHLSGTEFEPIIEPTIKAMQEISPDYLVPMHCSGWKAINRFMEAMPGRCILNTVGTTYIF